MTGNSFVDLGKIPIIVSSMSGDLTEKGVNVPKEEMILLNKNYPQFH